jgi:hypothetical protein
VNNFNFGEILTRAWQIVWKNKVLWIFGILASCARGGGGGSSGGGNSGYRSGSGDSPFSTNQFEQFGEQAKQFVENNLWIIIAVAVAIILLSLLAYFLGMMGRIGLIKGVAQAEKGTALSFGEIWAESMPFFWRIFGLNFLFGLAFLVLIVPMVILGVVTAGIGFLCFLPLICILIPIGWVLSIVIEQAQNAIVLEDLNMLDGFKRGWQVARANVGPMLIMALILAIGGGIIGLVIALPIIITVIPLAIGAAAMKEVLTPVYIALACCVVYLPVLIFLNGVLTAYLQSVWTLTYLRLTQPKEETPLIIEANA